METKKITLKNKSNTLMLYISAAVVLLFDGGLAYYGFSKGDSGLGCVGLFFALITMLGILLILFRSNNSDDTFIEIGDDGILFKKCARQIVDERTVETTTLKCGWDEVAAVSEETQRIYLSDGRIFTDMQVKSGYSPSSLLDMAMYRGSLWTVLPSSPFGKEAWKAIKEYYDEYNKTHKA